MGITGLDPAVYLQDLLPPEILWGNLLSPLHPLETVLPLSQVPLSRAPFLLCSHGHVSSVLLSRDLPLTVSLSHQNTITWRDHPENSK